MPHPQLAIGKGIGPVMIGLPLADIRSILGEPAKQSCKALGSIKLTDVYDTLGIHVYYDGADCVEFVESFRVEGVIHLLDGLPVFDTQ